MPSDGEKRVDFALKRLEDGEASRSDGFAVARDRALEDRETVVEHHLRHGADESALASPDATLDPDAAHRKQKPRVGLPVAHGHDGKIVVHVRQMPIVWAITSRKKASGSSPSGRQWVAKTPSASRSASVVTSASPTLTTRVMTHMGFLCGR